MNGLGSQPTGVYNPVNIKGIAEEVTRQKGGLSPCGNSWLTRFLDPCGPECTNLDLLKVPDGAVPMSVVGQYRFIDTIYPPFASRSEVDTTGKNYSMLVLCPPRLREMGVILVNRLAQEFGDVNIQDFISNYNSIPEDAGIFPDWLPCSRLVEVGGETVPLQYFTRISTGALQNLATPSDVGISADVSQFRFTTSGIDLRHNTPALFNQATAVIGQFNTNISHPSGKSGDETIRFSVTHRIVNDNQQPLVNLAISCTASGILVPGEDLKEVYMATDGLVYRKGDLTSVVTYPITGDFGLHREDGDIFAVIGDGIAITENTGGFVVYRNTTTGAEHRLFNYPGFVWRNQTSEGGHTYNSKLFFNSNIHPEVADTVGQTTNVVALPPVTQQDLAQADPEVGVQLFKEMNGFDVPQRVFQPVFNMTAAASYGRLLYATSKTPPSSLEVPTGIRDTVDANFSTAVANIQSVPYAAAPMLTIFRSVEFVPTENSIFGPFCTRSPPVDSFAMQTARTVCGIEPHSYPLGGNSAKGIIGTLLGALTQLPLSLLNQSVIDSTIRKACENNKPRKQRLTVL